jgi:transcriptional repressor NrdR
VKRDVTSQQLETLIDDIEADLHNTFRYEIPANKLGDLVLTRLRALDKVAYVRFASVYKDFQDLDQFTRELKELE